MSTEQDRVASGVPLPVSPQDTRSPEFEALIDLFATDGSKPEPVRSPNLKSATAGLSRGSGPASSGLTLRDKDGRLDFSKIKAMYAVSTPGIGIDSDQPRGPIAPESARSQSGGTNRGFGYGGFESDDRQGDLHGESNACDVNVAFVAKAKPTFQASTSTSNRGACSSPRISGLSLESTSPHAFDDSRLPVVIESTPLATSRPLGSDNVDFVGLSLNQSSLFPEPESVEELIQSSDPLLDKQGRVSEVRENPAISLRQSLVLARQELALLKTRCQELEELIHELRSSPQHERELAPRQNDLVSLPHLVEVNDRASHGIPNNQEGEVALASQGAATASDDSRALDVDSLAFAQARIALKSLLNDLALPSSCLPSLLRDGGKRRREGHVFSLEEIHRAVNMVTYIDELVWRRSRFGAVYDNPYSSESITALQGRLELWEKAVRTRH